VLRIRWIFMVQSWFGHCLVPGPSTESLWFFDDDSYGK